MVQTSTNNLHWLFGEHQMEPQTFDISSDSAKSQYSRSNSPSETGTMHYQPEGGTGCSHTPPSGNTAMKTSSQILNLKSPPSAITFYPDQYLEGVHSSTPQTASMAFHREHLLRKEVVHILLQESSPRISLMRQESGRSQVWRKFRIVMVDNRKTEYAACTQCLSVLTYRVRDGTSGLRKHVCSYHSSKHSSHDSSNPNNKPSDAASVKGNQCCPVFDDWNLNALWPLQVVYGPLEHCHPPANNLGALEQYSQLDETGVAGIPPDALAMLNISSPSFYMDVQRKIARANVAKSSQFNGERSGFPDLVERMGGVAAPSTSTSGSCGPLGGVRCKSEEALGAVGGYGVDDDDVDQRGLEENVTVESEFPHHDPLHMKAHVQGENGQPLTSVPAGLLSPPPTAAVLRLSQHHHTPLSTTGSATTNPLPSVIMTDVPPHPPFSLTGPYLLKKETHCSTVLDQLLRDETFTDVTLTAEGQSIRAHRVVLCLASAYFRQVLSHDQNVHSVVILRDIKFAELKSIIHFIYTGEATVDATELESFMKTAEILEISSLCEGHKSISTGGLVSQSYGSGFNIGEFERLMGTKRNRKDASPMPFKNRKISGEQSSRSSTPGISATSVTCVKEEPIDPDSNRMNTDDHGYRGSGRHSKGVLEESPGFASKTLSTAFDTGEMEAMEEGSNSGGDGKSDTSGRSSPSSMVPDITTLPGRCPYCPHLNQEFRGVSMMRHLLVSHPCKPAFPCDNCFRVFVRKNQFRAHQAKCNDV
ncbi:unnamed protein product, partial [Meganyctiphanes norvegica]